MGEKRVTAEGLVVKGNGSGGKGDEREQLSGRYAAESLEMRKDRQVVLTGKIDQQPNSNTHYVLVFKSQEVDCSWANNGMMASVLDGESALALQNRVEDADFPNVVVTPMGGKSVYSLFGWW